MIADTSSGEENFASQIEEQGRSAAEGSSSGVAGRRGAVESDVRLRLRSKSPRPPSFAQRRLSSKVSRPRGYPGSGVSQAKTPHSADVEGVLASQGVKHFAASALCPPKKPWRMRPIEERPGGGTAETKCCFSRTPLRLGERAQLHRGQQQCVLCDNVKLAAALANPQKRKHITRLLRCFRDNGQEDLFEKAVEKPALAAERDAIQVALSRPSRQKGAVELREEARKTASSWQKLLENRVTIGARPCPAEAAKYRKHVADDARRVQSKFGPVLRAREEGDESRRSNLARNFESWCREDSWVMCDTCKRMQKRSLGEIDITGQRRNSHSVRKCKHCCEVVGYATVQEDDIPKVLRDLSKDIIDSLRPLAPFAGEVAWARHGYRVHTDMLRFWLRPSRVTQRMQLSTNAEEKAKARAAYKYLMASGSSSYAKFVAMHNRVLTRNRDNIEN